MGMARLFGLGLALLFTSSVTASTIDVGPSNWRNYGPSGAHTTGGVKSTFGQQVRMPPTISGPTRVLPVSRNPVIPYGSIANGLRNFTRVSPQSVAASAAVTGLFLAVDWVFDEASGQWGKEGYEEVPTEDPFFQWQYSVDDGIRGSTPEEACVAGISAYPPDPSSYAFTGTATIQPAGTNRFTCIGDGVYPNGSPMKFQSGSVSRVGSECPPGSSWVDTLNACATSTIIDLDPSDWSELESTLPSSNPQQVANAASDTQLRIGSPLPGYQDLTMTGPESVSGPTTTSTSTDPVTGDTTVTETSTQTYINYGDTTITTTNTTTTTTYQNGQETSTTVTTETPGELPVSSGGGASGDWPGFCDWATVVCDWLDWTREDPPPEQDLPAVIDDDFYQEKQISFGSKTCPEPYAISLAPFMETTVGVSFQPLCDFAGLIYYMVMAASYIIAAYISIGVARNA